MHVAHLLAPRARQRGRHQGHRLHARRHPCATRGRRRRDANDRARAVAGAGRSDRRRDRARLRRATKKNSARQADRRRRATPTMTPRSVLATWAMRSSAAPIAVDADDRTTAKRTLRSTARACSRRRSGSQGGQMNAQAKPVMPRMRAGYANSAWTEVGGGLLGAAPCQRRLCLRLDCALRLGRMGECRHADRLLSRLPQRMRCTASRRRAKIAEPIDGATGDGNGRLQQQRHALWRAAGEEQNRTRTMRRELARGERGTQLDDARGDDGERRQLRRQARARTAAGPIRTCERSSPGACRRATARGPMLALALRPGPRTAAGPRDSFAARECRCYRSLRRLAGGALMGWGSLLLRGGNALDHFAATAAGASLQPPPSAR